MSEPTQPVVKDVATLQAEVEWFTTALTNARDYPYHPEYLKGFESALGWLKLHLSMAAEREAQS